jgi:hypothetical protein
LDFRFWIEIQIAEPKNPKLVEQWLRCGFRSSYSCGAAEEFAPTPQSAANFGFWTADFGFNRKSKI